MSRMKEDFKERNAMCLCDCLYMCVQPSFVSTREMNYDDYQFEQDETTGRTTVVVELVELTGENISNEDDKQEVGANENQDQFDATFEGGL